MALSVVTAMRKRLYCCGIVNGYVTGKDFVLAVFLWQLFTDLKNN